MDPFAIYTLVTGVGSIIQRWLSQEAQEQMEAYRRAAIEKEQDEMLALSRVLYEIRQKQDSEIHEAILRQQEKSNKEAIINIANKTEQYTKWPLKVPPLCLRGTSSLLPDSLRSSDFKMPLYFMLAPGSDKGLNNKIPEIEDYLDNFITKHFTVPGENRIVMLRNCWLNPLKNCDEATARNIHSFIPDVPMVILYPSSTLNGVDFGCAFWNIAPLGLDDEGNIKYSYSFDSPLHLSDNPEIEFTRLCDSIAISISILADLYGWGHYRCAPKLIQLAMEDNLSFYPGELQKHYYAYVDILKDMVANGLIDYEKECDAILNYCEAVDTPVEKALAFDALQLMNGKKELFDQKDLLGKLPLETQGKIWKYIDANYTDILSQIGRDTLFNCFVEYNQLLFHTQILLQLDFTSKNVSDKEIKEIIKRYKNQFVKHVSCAKLQLLEKGQSQAANGIDVRNWFRPEMRKSINQIMEGLILPGMLSDTSELLIRKYKSSVKCIINDLGIPPKCSFFNAKDMSSIYAALEDMFYHNFIDKIHRIDIEKYIEVVKVTNTGASWVNGVAQRWINYHLFGEDDVYTLSYIGESISQKEDKELYEDIKYSIESYLETFIRRLLGEPDPERYSSSGSDSYPSYFDTVVMSPSY